VVSGCKDEIILRETEKKTTEVNKNSNAVHKY